MVLLLRHCLRISAVLLLVAGVGQGSAPGQSGQELNAVSQPPAQEHAAADPLPLRRVVIPLERVAAELQRARPGVLVQLPRADFEARVLAATAGLEAARTVPRLVKAFYAAELVGTTLAAGSGQWTVQHGGSAPGILPLPQFNLALSKIRVGAGAGDGVLADFDGKNLGLAIEGPGQHEVLFDWTLRGQPQADGLAFQLRVPGCPIAVLELKLPADHALVVDRAAGILSGPLPAEKPGVRIWRLQTTGRSHLDLLVRKHSEPGAAQLLLASVESKQELKPSVALVDYDFRLETVQGGTAELVFEGDGILEPYEVTARGAELAGWDSQNQPGDAKTGSRRVVQIDLREPLRGTAAVRVRCWCRRQADQEWRSPELRLRQAITRGETLLLDIPAPLQLERWDPGHFHVVDAATDADGGQKLRLVDRAPEAPNRQRPRLWALGDGAGLFVQSHTRWSIEPGGMTLAAELACELGRGQAYQVNVPMPAGAWHVEQVALEPGGGLQGWTLAGPMLVLDLKRALNPRNPLKISVRLRSAWKGSGPPGVLSISELVVAGAAARQATYEIHIDPGYQAALTASSVTPTATDRAAAAGSQPRFAFAYRDRALIGVVRVSGRPAALTAHVIQQVTLGPGRGALRAQLNLEPVAGHAAFVDLFFSGGRGLRYSAADAAGTVELKLERRAGIEFTAPLLALGAGHPWGLLASMTSIPRGESWRLTLPEPLQQSLRVVLRGELRPEVIAPLGASLSCLRPNLTPAEAVWGALHIGTELLPQMWDVPVITVPGAEHVQASVVLQGQGHALTTTRPRGLTETAPPAWAPSTPRFQYGTSAPWPELTAWTQPGRADLPQRPPLDEALITHYAAGDGKTYHHVQIQVGAWQDADLPVRLPATGWTLLAARLDGHWLHQLEQAATAGGSEVRLPVPRDGAAHALEMLLVSEGAGGGWSPLVSVRGVSPEFPAVVLRQRHVWRLGPGLAPLRQETMRSWQAGLGVPLQWLRPLWHAADAWSQGLMPLDDETWIEPQRRALQSAETAVHRRLSADSMFGPALERLLVEGLKEQSPLILDREALAALGVRPDSGWSAGLALAEQPFWESYGLTVVPTPSAPVLTSRSWSTKPLPREQLHAATEEAALHGQDASGRFCRADFWLRHEPPADRVTSPAWPPFLGAGLMEGWTEWEFVAGAETAPALAVVRTGHVRFLGLASALVLFFLLMRVGRLLRPPMALRLLMLATVAVGFAVVVLPQTLSELAFWPLLVVLAQLVWSWLRCLREAPRSGPRSVPPAPRAAAVAGAVLLSAVWLATPPAPAQPESADTLTVFYVDAGPDRQLALVRPELLKRLEELHRQAVAPIRGAFLTGASYAGKWQGDAARIDAQFELYSFADEATLHVPLAQVELLDGAFLDGAPAFPSAAKGKSGFVVPVSRRGFHRLTLAMTARPQLSGDYREVRCGIPALALSRLSWQAPLSQRELQIVKVAGEESRTASSQTQEVRGQLGREGALHVRWRATDGPAAAAVHEVREAYFWDLDDELPTLTAVLRYTPSKANLGKIDMVLPERLEVHHVEVRGEGAASPPRLARWHVAGKGAARRLVVELAAPASAPVVLQLKAVPRFPLGFSQVSLPLPLPLAANAVEGFLAYRLEGADAADKTRNLGVTALAPEVFAKAWGTSSPDAVLPTRAYSFRRAAAAASLELTLQPLRPQAKLEWSWKIEPTQAELRGQAELVGGAGLHCVEMKLPAPLKLTQVHAADLHHWSVHDGRLQIWFRQGGKERLVTFAGWLAKPVVKQRFTLPRLEPIGADVAATVVRVAAAPGWTIAAESVKNLRPEPDEQGLAFHADAGYQGVFGLRPLPLNLELDALTTVEPRGELLAMTVDLAGRAAPGRGAAFTVRLRDWPAPVRLEASAPLVRQVHRRLGRDQEWALQFPAGCTQIALQLRSYLHAAGATALPTLQIQGAQLREQVIVLPNDSLRTVSMQGLEETRAPLPGRALDAIRKKGATVWHAVAGDWQAVVQPNPRGTAALRVLHAEQHSAWSNGRWLHQIEYLLQARDAPALALSLPPQAQLTAMQVDGRPLEVAHAAGAGLSIPLPEHADLVKVRLVWHYPPEAESMLRPRLAAPAVAGPGQSIVRGLLLVPSGVTLSEGADLSPGDAPLLLGRLEAAVEASKGDRAEVSWLERGAVVRSLRRHLDYVLRLEPTAPQTPQMQQQLQALGKQIRSGEPKAAPAATSDLQGLGILPDRLGLPYAWQQGGAAGPAVTLTSRGSAPGPEDWARELLTLTLVGLFLLSWLPGAMSWLRYAWPEMLAGLTLIACVAWGWSAIGVALLFFAVAARLLALAQLLANSARSAGRSPSSVQPLAGPGG
jgi:hypothetical protein